MRLNGTRCQGMRPPAMRLFRRLRRIPWSYLKRHPWAISRAVTFGGVSGHVCGEASLGDFEGSDLLNEATEALTEKSLAERGFVGVTPSGGGSILYDIDAWTAIRLDHWWGVSQAQYGAEFGYRPVPIEEHMTVKISSDLPEGYEDARYSTDGESGCQGQAWDVINEGAVATSEELQAIGTEI